jgi:hypothetical protein
MIAMVQPKSDGEEEYDESELQAEVSNKAELGIRLCF